MINLQSIPKFAVGILIRSFPPQAQRHARGTLPRRGALASGA